MDSLGEAHDEDFDVERNEDDEDESLIDPLVEYLCLP